MKPIIYLITGLVLSGMSLTSCNEDRYSEMTEHITNGTANVPEGYMLVSFVPKGSPQTRANHQGEGTDLFHIQYILYDGEGKVVRQASLLDNEQGTSVSWPYQNGGFSQALKRGETYRIVYLGNVASPKNSGSEEQLLTGSEQYSTARIHIPENGFEGNNLFYIFSKEFTVSSDKEQTSMTIDVVLRRLVSKHRIASYGIPDGFDPGTGSYADRFWESLLNEEHPLRLGRQVFGDINSMLGKQFREQVFKDIIFPVAYLFFKNNCVDENTKLGKDWNNGTIAPDSYWNNYTDPNGMKASLESIANNGNYDWKNAAMEEWGKRAAALYQLIADMYEDKDGILTEMYKRLQTDDIAKVEGSQVGRKDGAYTQAKKNTAKLLKTALQSSGFGVWDYDQLTVESSIQIPTEIDLDLKVTDKEEFGRKQIKPSADGALDFYLLGTADDTPVFSFTKIYDKEAGDVAYPDLTEFPSQPLTPNVAYTYRIQPKDGVFNLDTDQVMDEDTPDNIYFSYYNMLSGINLSDRGLNLKDLTDSESSFPRLLQLPMAVVYSCEPKDFQLDSEKGVYYYAGNDQFHIVFNHPDFTTLEIKTEWGLEDSSNN